jgi:nucleotide-binding universal stress UspA family protein
MAREILIGYDGTPGAHSAATEALRLAKDLGVGVVVGFAYGTSPLGGEAGDLRASLREIGQQRAAEVLAEAEQAGVPARTELVDDRPAEGLVALADDHDAQMIVVGSHGDTPLKGAILGSTPHKLLHLSERPVLVVRG